MSYHPASLSGLSWQGAPALPQSVIDAARYAGPYAAPVGADMLGGARKAITSGQMPAVGVEDIARKVAGAVVAGGCAAGGAAAGPLAPAVAAGCGWLGKQMQGDLGFMIEPRKGQIPPKAFYDQLLAAAKAGCADGDDGCRASVKSVVDALTIGETSPLRAYNLWAGDHCKSCSTSYWSGNTTCNLVEDPGCHVKTPWPQSVADAQAKIAAIGAKSRMAAEALFTASVVAAAQGVKPQMVALCGGEAECGRYVDLDVDLSAVDVALTLRREGVVPADEQWRKSLEKLASYANQTRDTAAELAQIKAQQAAADAAVVKARTAAKAKATRESGAAYLQDYFSGQAADAKSARRRQVVGVAFFCVLAGAGWMYAKRGRR